MKTKIVNGKHEFADTPKGMIFFGVDRVQLLERATGKQRTLALSTLKKDLPAAKYKRVEDDLMMIGLYTDNSYQIMGLENNTPAFTPEEERIDW